ncbi:MAG TPA: hypothetical protein VFP17_07870 [Solirubrobacterales bacterium]|nr:hypothetical protein [Solirubrobacterales bacterium]
MTQVESGRLQVTNEGQSLRPKGKDARDEVPELKDEALQFLRDQLTNSRPSTVLGVLIDRRRPLEVVTVAGLIGEPLPQVEWTIEVLEIEGLCATFDDDGVSMVALREPLSAPQP